MSTHTTTSSPTLSHPSASSPTASSSHNQPITPSLSLLDDEDMDFVGMDMRIGLAGAGTGAGAGNEMDKELRRALGLSGDEFGIGLTDFLDLEMCDPSSSNASGLGTSSNPPSTTLNNNIPLFSPSGINPFSPSPFFNPNINNNNTVFPPSTQHHQQQQQQQPTSKQTGTAMDQDVLPLSPPYDSSIGCSPTEILGRNNIVVGGLRQISQAGWNGSNFSPVSTTTTATSTTSPGEESPASATLHTPGTGNGKKFEDPAVVKVKEEPFDYYVSPTSSSSSNNSKLPGLPQSLNGGQPFDFNSLSAEDQATITKFLLANLTGSQPPSGANQQQQQQQQNAGDHADGQGLRTVGEEELREINANEFGGKRQHLAQQSRKPLTPSSSSPGGSERKPSVFSNTSDGESLSIDPSNLVKPTSTKSKVRSNGGIANANNKRREKHGNEEEIDEDDDDDDEDMDGRSDRARSESVLEETFKLSLPASFGGVKGKGGKKGGGMSSVVLADGEEAGSDDDWRPSPEEYKKLSSKEKRQLRNKLSARAFRNRRKNYVNELEDSIRDRDRLIEAIRSELVERKSENDELRREIDALKKAALIPTPASLQRPSQAPDNGLASSLGVTGIPPKPTGSILDATPLNVFNPRKDVASFLSGSDSLSPKAVRNFWVAGGGAGLNDMLGGGGGMTSVHAAFTPDLTLPSSTGSSNAPSPESTASSASVTTPPSGLPAMPYIRTNLNPLLNAPPKEPINYFNINNKGDGSDLSDSFDGWTDANAFSLRSLDAYRMQLWSRMARDAALSRNGVPVDMRPKFLRDPTERRDKVSSKIEEEQRLAVIMKNRLADSQNTSQQSTSSSKQPERSRTPVENMGEVVQKAISTRLFSAFVSAFQVSSGGTSSLDADKVAAVFTGKAGLKVVPSSPVKETKSVRSTSTSATTASVDPDSALATSFANLKVATDSLGINLSSSNNNSNNNSNKLPTMQTGGVGGKERKNSGLGGLFGLAQAAK